MTSLPISNSTFITITTPFNNPLLSKPSQLFPPNRRRIATTISSHANQNNHNDHSPKLDRRNILIGLTGMYGAATTVGGVTPIATASPPIPDVKNCHLTTATDDEGRECCPPSFKNIIDFDIRNYPSPKLRIRKPAHIVANDKDYMSKFEEAIRRMKALHHSDPRSFMQQANVHCAYCDGSYDQLGYPGTQFLVHGSWLFFPFHRAYLYFFERILGKLIDDPNFAMPYWNWDHPDGMRMPTIYTNPDSPLYDRLRDSAHQPPKLVDLSYNNVDSKLSDDLQIEYNIVLMYFQMMRNSTPDLFMGERFSAGPLPIKGAGALETMPHNNVHNWVGDRNDKPFNRDMGIFFSAARDPIFYSHHSNIDRMWHLWNTKLNRPNFTSSDWLDTYFVFYDENGQGVRMSTRDCLNIEQLGYTYDDQDLPWLNTNTKNMPKPKPAIQLRTARVTFPKTLDSVIRTRVARPKASRSQKEKDVAKEVLNIFLTVEKEDEYIKFDVFVNDGQDFNESQTVIGRSYAGSYVSLPHKITKGGSMNMNHRLKLPLTEILEDLGTENDEYVDVAIVPKAGKGNVVINNVEVGYVI